MTREKLIERAKTAEKRAAENIARKLADPEFKASLYAQARKRAPVPDDGKHMRKKAVA